MIWMICSLIGIERTPEQNGGSVSVLPDLRRDSA